jgi:glycosyltransferase involved in cell wall biosynthesis
VLDADVVLLGERSDTAELMRAADLLVLPSREEGLSNVLLEAMAAALPVVASDAGGSPELVADGRSGLLFPNGDVEALGDALTRLLTEPVLRAQMGSAARTRIEREFAIDTLVQRSLDRYDRCLESP